MDEQWWVKLDQLDDDQRSVITLPKTGSYMVLGPPGCGKTNLLLLRASYLFKSGIPNIKIVVFTRTLQKFLMAGGERYSFPAQKLGTSQRFWESVLFDCGAKCPRLNDFEAQRKATVDAVREVVDRDKLSSMYDTIFLDEVQDYLPAEIELFATLGRDLFAVGDLRQKIYLGSESVSVAEKVVSSVHKLRYHYRTGREICALADGILKNADQDRLMLPTCNYDENRRPSTVVTSECKDLAEQADLIVDRLSVQLRAYPDEMLAVIAPKRSEVRELGDYLLQSNLGELVTGQIHGQDFPDFSHGKRICVLTVHSAKGLEFRGVHFAAADSVRKFPHQRNMVYTTVTRAKTSLNIYYVGSLPGYFDSALKGLYRENSEPSLKDLFGGGE